MRYEEVAKQTQDYFFGTFAKEQGVDLRDRDAVTAFVKDNSDVLRKLQLFTLWESFKAGGNTAAAGYIAGRLFPNSSAEDIASWGLEEALDEIFAVSREAFKERVEEGGQ